MDSTGTKLVGKDGFYSTAFLEADNDSCQVGLFEMNASDGRHLGKHAAFAGV